MTSLERPPSARDLSYAASAETRGGKAVIRVLENSTGRLGLIRRARGYEAEVAAGRGFFEVMAERYGLSFNLVQGELGLIPSDRPVILIANHPYGILDGLIMGLLLSQAGTDFRILANAVFNRAPDLGRIILPISFDETKAAVAQNIATRRAALAHLAGGGAIGVFPGGTVSTARKPFARPLDPAWRSFTARMIAKSDAVVVPVYFEGYTSRLFQIASHLHSSLRLGLLINEFRTRVDTPVDLAIGEPIGRDRLDPLAKDSKAMMDFLRKATYELSSEPVKPFDLGYDFEERQRSWY